MGGGGPGRRDQLGALEVGGENLALEVLDVGGVDQAVVACGNRVLPQLRRGNLRTAQPEHGAHVAVSELVPGAREGVRERFGVLVETLADGPIDRVEDQCEVRREHHRAVESTG